MERQEVSEGSCVDIGSVYLDATQLGTGSQASTPTNQSGVTSQAGPGSNYKFKRTGRKKKLTVGMSPSEASRFYSRRHYEKNHKKELARRKTNYHANREKELAYHRELRKRNPEPLRQRNRDFYRNNKALSKQMTNAWRAAHPEIVKATAKKYLPRKLLLRKLRIAKNPSLKIKEACRASVYRMLKESGIEKQHKTFELVGCTPDFLKGFIEARFTGIMSWSNYGIAWQLDHVIPLASFDLTDPVQLKTAFHYSNCQPLGVLENNIKGATLPHAHQPSLI